MKKLLIGITATSLFVLASLSVVAGPLEDGVAAYEAGNFKRSAKLFKQAMKEGNRGFGTIERIKAETYLGEMYLKGEGVKQSDNKAWKYLSDAEGRDDRASVMVQFSWRHL